MNINMKMIGTAALMCAAVSCTQMNPSGTETVPCAKVVMSQNNFRVIATQVSAEDSGFSLFPGLKSLVGGIGAAIPGVNVANIPAGLEIVSPSESKIMGDIYKASGACHTGRATQLVNVRKERGGFNAIIFGRPRVRITADLIEFTN